MVQKYCSPYQTEFKKKRAQGLIDIYNGNLINRDQDYLVTCTWQIWNELFFFFAALFTVINTYVGYRVYDKYSHSEKYRVVGIVYDGAGIIDTFLCCHLVAVT